MVSSATWIVILSVLSICGQLFAGNFVGDVTVEYNVFAVMENDEFVLKCTAQHEDKRPELSWYSVDFTFKRTNQTGFDVAGTGNTATSTLRKTQVRRDQAGDYFCEAKVDNVVEISNGVPITVIPENDEPRVNITEGSGSDGKRLLTCLVVPKGKGDLTWRKDGDNLKSEKGVQKLDFEPPTRGKYECFGNLTLAGYKFFESRAYSSGAADWFQMTTLAVHLPSVFTSIFIFSNFLSF